jgi:hypothetical protein
MLKGSILWKESNQERQESLFKKFCGILLIALAVILPERKKPAKPSTEPDDDDDVVAVDDEMIPLLAGVAVPAVLLVILAFVFLASKVT